MASSLGLGITAWSPLAGGLLTGKYADPKPDDAGTKRYDSPAASQFRPSGDRASAIAKEVQAVAKECGRSAAQVALAWLQLRSMPIIPIIGARKVEQLKDNLASVEVKLDQSQLNQLNDASRVELGFPHDFYEKEQVRTIVYGGMRDLIDT